eukprot:7040036-Pyramimonas_sp.AAC.1
MRALRGWHGGRVGSSAAAGHPDRGPPIGHQATAESAEAAGRGRPPRDYRGFPMRPVHEHIAH